MGIGRNAEAASGDTQTMNITDQDRLKLEPFAWPGGYPVMYLATDAWRNDDGTLEPNRHSSENVCCAKCARDTENWPDLIIVAQYAHYEGPAEYCEYCNGFTESAYGDPEKEVE
jgi:hypothetical protein